MAVTGHHSPGTMSDPAPHGDHGDLASHHPGDREYIRIAVILTLITIAEVAIYYIEGVRDFLVPALIIMSVGKFIVVVGYFMHLKFDDRRFTVLFVTGLVISLAVVAALVVMMLTNDAYFPDAPPAGVAETH